MALDYRKRCTQKLVKETMIELLEEKPLHKIKVKELCEKAGINRATFYNNYEDIYDLYESMENEFLDKYTKIIAPKKMFLNSEEMEMMFFEQVDFFLENKKLFMIFYRNDRCSFLLKQLIEEETKWMVSFPEFKNWVKSENIAFNSEEELRKMIIFSSNGIFALIYTMISENEKIEREEISKLLLNFFYKRMLVK